MSQIFPCQATQKSKQCHLTQLSVTFNFMAYSLLVFALIFLFFFSSFNIKLCSYTCTELEKPGLWARTRAYNHSTERPA